MGGRRGTRSRDEFVVAAMALVEQRGWDALTMRALGEWMGIEHTVIYRHFASKQVLIDSVLDHALASQLRDAEMAALEPRERVLGRLVAFRAILRANPHLGMAIMRRQVSSDVGRELIRETIGDLATMGLEGDRLVACYQALESLTAGSSMFDFRSGHAEMAERVIQYRALNVEAFDVVARDAKTVAALTEEAFAISLSSVLDAFITRAG